MKFRLAAKDHDGNWINLIELGAAKLSECKAAAREAFDTGAFQFVGVFNSKGQRRWWLS